MDIYYNPKFSMTGVGVLLKTVEKYSSYNAFWKKREINKRCLIKMDVE